MLLINIFCWLHGLATSEAAAVPQPCSCTALPPLGDVLHYLSATSDTWEELDDPNLSPEHHRQHQKQLLNAPHLSHNPYVTPCASTVAAKTLKFLPPSALLALEHFQGEQYLGIQQSLTIFLIYLTFRHDVTTWVVACFASNIRYPAKDAFYRHMHGSVGRRLKTARNITSHG